MTTGNLCTVLDHLGFLSDDTTAFLVDFHSRPRMAQSPMTNGTVLRRRRP